MASWANCPNSHYCLAVGHRERGWTQEWCSCPCTGPETSACACSASEEALAPPQGEETHGWWWRALGSSHSGLFYPRRSFYYWDSLTSCWKFASCLLKSTFQNLADSRWRKFFLAASCWGIQGWYWSTGSQSRRSVKSQQSLLGRRSCAGAGPPAQEGTGE